MKNKGIRVVSGMRPTGFLHLGHYHGVLKNWLVLQNRYQSFFFVADMHALTNQKQEPEVLQKATVDMIIDWLAVGIDPKRTEIFVQSQIRQISELTILLAMNVPLSWLERIPTFKEARESIDRESISYGLLTYPLLQAADILLYEGSLIPVGQDQLSHIEFVRSLARRFNYLYGGRVGFESLDQILPEDDKKLLFSLRRSYHQDGNVAALEEGEQLIDDLQNLKDQDRIDLRAFLRGTGREIFLEPTPLKGSAPSFPGLDGRKMSKSYGNTIALREEPKEITVKVMNMPTDPARVRRTDPGEPKKCLVFKFHTLYDDEDELKELAFGCRQAQIGCVECKKNLAKSITDELKPIREKAVELEKQSDLVNDIISDSEKNVSKIAETKMQEVRRLIGIKDS